MKYILILILLFCRVQIKENLEFFPFEVISFEKLINNIDYKNKKILLRDNQINSITIHYTKGMTSKEYIEKSIQSDFLVQLIISKSGEIYGFKNPHQILSRATPKLDIDTIHLSLEGTEEEILNNEKQIDLCKQIILFLSENFLIPISNSDIESKKGIFTNLQVKKKFGNFVDLNDNGIESILKKIFIELKKDYTAEENWINRYEKNWIVRKEKKIQSPEIPFTNGRELTRQDKLELEELEKDDFGFTPENYRLKYVFKKLINPSCIVLHFTAISSFKISQDTLERRKLSASIMVDKDGKAYQLLDNLKHLAQAASGTNEHCIQIEIVGKNTEELMNNEIQFLKVASITNSICKKYNISKNNFNIESLSGIYSHTQAKKRFGGSVALVGKDFDPGEPYMKKIIEFIAGIYYEEKYWYNRNSDDWIILNSEFQP